MTQNFNRYSYCLNNPLVYVDLSGKKWWKWLLGDILTGGLISTTAITNTALTFNTLAITGATLYSTVLLWEHTTINYNGITLGNYINMNITGEINQDFVTYITQDPMYMHEYGHYLDSQTLGISYLFVIGVPSIFSVSNNKAIPNNPDGLWSHDVFWAEKRANRRAAKYFKEKYNINWNFPKYPL